VLTPYDWQEGIGNRAQYIEGRLSQGSPVLGLSIEEGIVFFTYRKQARKIYEIYDRLIFGGLGQQSDIEGFRVAALEFASREGYNRSEEDVTIQRVATAMSSAAKRAFADFTSAPFVAKSLFGEVNATPQEDLFYAIDYDGDYTMHRQHALIAGTDFAAGRLEEKLKELRSDLSVDQALEQLKEVWGAAARDDGEEPDKGLMPEAVLLERSDVRENRFRLLYPEEF
jgi:proteasome alpha subunit